MNDRLALELAVKRAPNTPLHRLALADFYEEAGLQDRADALRWMLRGGKRPNHLRNGSTRSRWAWTAELLPGCDYGYSTHLVDALRVRHFTIPQLLIKVITQLHHRTTFSTRHAAEWAILDAWGRAVETGWCPHLADAPIR